MYNFTEPVVAASCLKKVARVIYQDESNRVIFDETVNKLKNKYQITVEAQQFWTLNEAANCDYGDSSLKQKGLLVLSQQQHIPDWKEKCVGP